MERLDLLIYLGRLGALARNVTISTPKMGSDLGISQQSVSRWLIRLQEDGMISRKEGIRSYLLRITDKGKMHMSCKRNELSEILLEKGQLSLNGIVVSGMMEGRYYIGLADYSDRIEAKLGFRPFPGTLNIKLVGMEDIACKERLSAMKGIEVEGFRKGGRTFGAIRCFHCTIRGIVGAVVIPERTHYGIQIVELISPFNLREKMGLSNGDSIEVQVRAE